MAQQTYGKRGNQECQESMEFEFANQYQQNQESDSDNEQGHKRPVVKFELKVKI